MMSLTTEEFIQRATRLHNGKYDYSLTAYTHSHSLVTIICRTHGRFEQQASVHLLGKGCPTCGKRRMTQEEFIAAANRVHANTYDYSNTLYVNNKTNVSIICPEHGEFLQTPNNHLSGKGCRLCANKRISAARKATAKPFIVAATDAHGNKYDYSQVEYTSSSEYVTIICPTHGPFQQTPNNHYTQKHGCPACAGVISSGEIEIAEWFTDMGEEVIKGSRKIIPPYELDIWLPQHNLAIEHSGLYWHSDARQQFCSMRTKWELCDKQGIQLIQILEDEWVDARQIILNRFRASLGKSNKVHARECVVKEIESSLAREFMKENHINGFIGGSHIGLIHRNQTLVAVLTYAKSRYTEKVDMEILRYATNAHIPGALSKLVQYLPNGKILSYSDLRFGSGKVYAQAGFVENGITPPDYWWWKHHYARLSRYQTQKHKLKTHPLFAEYYKEEKTEEQICREAGFSKIIGVGHKRWLLTK